VRRIAKAIDEMPLPWQWRLARGKCPWEREWAKEDSVQADMPFISATREHTAVTTLAWSHRRDDSEIANHRCCVARRL